MSRIDASIAYMSLACCCDQEVGFTCPNCGVMKTLENSKILINKITPWIHTLDKLNLITSKQYFETLDEIKDLIGDEKSSSDEIKNDSFKIQIFENNIPEQPSWFEDFNKWAYEMCFDKQNNEGWDMAWTIYKAASKKAQLKINERDVMMKKLIDWMDRLPGSQKLIEEARRTLGELQ